MEFSLSKITLAVLYAALCVTLHAQPTNSLSYPVFGTKRYHRSAGRSSAIGQPPPAPPPAPPLYGDTSSADEYYDPYSNAYVVTQPDGYRYQPQPDEEAIEYWPRRESQYYGMPTYRGEYNPKPYYYSHGPSYSYYDDRGDLAPNPLDDLHEEIQQEDARERQREMAGESDDDWYNLPTSGGRRDSRLTSTFLKNLMAYNQQINQQKVSVPEEPPYGYNLDYDLAVEQELPQQRHNVYPQSNQLRKHHQPYTQKQFSFYDYGDNVMKELAQENESTYPLTSQIEEPQMLVDHDVEALKTLVSTEKEPKAPKNNRKSSKKQKQRRKQNSKKEKERKERQQALEEQREQLRLAEQEQQARRELLAKQQEEERRQQQELERQQTLREKILMQHQLQGQNQPLQYSDYQQEPSSGADYFVEPEYDDSWTSWDRKRSYLPPLPGNQRATALKINPISTTLTSSLSSSETASHSKPIKGDGQKEIMLPRPANPVLHPFTAPIMNLLTHNKLENVEDLNPKNAVHSDNSKPKSHEGDTTVYGTIKHLMDMEQKLDQQVHQKTLQKRYVTNEESLVRQLKNLKQAV